MNLIYRFRSFLTWIQIFFETKCISYAPEHGYDEGNTFWSWELLFRYISIRGQIAPAPGWTLALPLCLTKSLRILIVRNSPRPLPEVLAFFPVRNGFISRTHFAYVMVPPPPHPGTTTATRRLNKIQMRLCYPGNAALDANLVFMLLLCATLNNTVHWCKNIIRATCIGAFMLPYVMRFVWQRSVTHSAAAIGEWGQNLISILIRAVESVQNIQSTLCFNSYLFVISNEIRFYLF